MKSRIFVLVLAMTASSSALASAAKGPAPESELDRALRGKVTKINPVTVEGSYVWATGTGATHQEMADRVCRVAGYEHATAFQTKVTSNPQNTESVRYYVEVAVITEHLRVFKTNAHEGRGIFSNHLATVFEFVYCAPIKADVDAPASAQAVR